MYVHVLLLLLSGELAHSLRPVDTGTNDRESSTVNKRLDALERLLRQQQDENAQQDLLLRKQAAELSRLGSLLRQQHVVLSHQSHLLRHQAAKLSHQESILSQYVQHTQELKAWQQGSNSSLRDSPDSKLQSSQEVVTSSSLDYHIQTLTGSDEVFPSTSHDVMSRSDDAGRLKVVVNQLSQHVTEMEADLQAMRTDTNTQLQTLKTSVTQHNHDIQDAQSSTFVHWGSSQCANNSQLVYSGVVGGSWWQDPGAATNYLCLTMSPVFSDRPAPVYRALLYGSEYETVDSHDDKNAVCSVCRSTFSTTLMIPGTNVCTHGWQLLYSGYLMAGIVDQVAGSEYICVDSKLENRIASNLNENGRMLFFTVTRCGSLPCTPYVNDKVVTCAVCGK